MSERGNEGGPSRRRVVRAAVASLGLGVAGCLRFADGDESSTNTAGVREATFEFRYEPPQEAAVVEFTGGGRPVAKHLVFRTADGQTARWHELGSTSVGPDTVLTAGVTARLGPAVEGWNRAVAGATDVALVYRPPDGASVVLRTFAVPTAEVPTATTTRPSATRSQTDAPADVSTDTPTATPEPPTPKLTADEGNMKDEFGATVGLRGDAAFVGAPAAQTSFTGAVYVFTPVDGAWRQQTKLTPEDSTPSDAFGSALAVGSDWLVVTAPRAFGPAGDEAGVAYVFAREDGAWRQQRKITVGDGTAEDRFGQDVAVAGDTVVIGDPEHGPNPQDTPGAAYVFEWTGDTWRQRTRFTPDDGDGGHRFGRAVAVSEDTAVVGTPGQFSVNGTSARPTYVFERTSEGWRQETTLVPDDRDSGHALGESVAIDGTTAVVGAPYDTNQRGENAGAVYVFERTSEGWGQTAKLTASNGGESDFLGTDVSINGDTILVGSYWNDNSHGTLAGTAYVYQRSNDGWRQESILTAFDGDDHDEFGKAVALSANRALVGASWDEDPHGERSGSAYVFDL